MSISTPETSLPPEIIRVADGDVVRYTLPPRQFGTLRVLGLLPVAFGLLFGGFAVVWMALAAGLVGAGGVHPLRLIFAAWGIPFLLAGLAVVRYGLLVLLPSHGELIITPRHIVGRDVAGLIRWTRRMRRDRVANLRISGLSQANLSGSEFGFAAKYGSALLIQKKRGKPMMAVLAYPRAWLDPLAAALSDDLGGGDLTATLRVDGPTAQTGPAVMQDPEPMANGGVQPPVLEKPADSKIEMVQGSDTLTLVIPPAGAKSTLRGLLVFSIFWVGFCGLMTTIIVLSVLMPDKVKHEGSPLIGLLFMIPFWGVGVGMLLGGLQMSRRKAVILVTPESVVFTQSGPLGQKEKQWPRSQIATVEASPSGVSVNDRPVPQLKLIFKSGKPFGLLTGRSDAELAWLAGVLRQYL